ncbi:MAG: hypothetical protein AVDCRST_MAG35-340, partial [uncultured Quadrisphaera sp.]
DRHRHRQRHRPPQHQDPQGDVLAAELVGLRQRGAGHLRAPADPRRRGLGGRPRPHRAGRRQPLRLADGVHGGLLRPRARSDHLRHPPHGRL